MQRHEGRKEKHINHRERSEHTEGENLGLLAVASSVLCGFCCLASLRQFSTATASDSSLSAGALRSPDPCAGKLVLVVDFMSLGRLSGSTLPGRVGYCAHVPRSDFRLYASEFGCMRRGIRTD